ncbi:LysR family transcriptional regulator [Pelagicoccus sp. SDUM812003]|uniref:LysR family transcriptional regulator n=1 Tax=Pelagicoccus sp. SDUM812003 TaxID=3041267 RepID=UPI0028104741|nr:LysR family transcriptional regulator [Pelagicoccus sp. SDUM812003]MDQ8204667.1 LysR family transcriptional regulator [Pelagicoccus sp. SDUM812003]
MREDPIDSRQMQIFVALAHGGSLRAAATHLKVTESAISHAIRNLENNLGTKLFARVGKGLSLTEDGKLFRTEAVKILSRMQDLRSRLSNRSSKRLNEIHLTCATSFIQFALPDILREYRRCFPNVEVKVSPADRDTCLKRLETGNTTAAILVNMPPESPKYQGSPLFVDELQVLMAADHELAAHAAIPVHRLSAENVYLQNHNNFTSRMVLSEIQRWSFQPKNLTYVGNPEALRELIKMKLGISLQPLWAFREGLDSHHFVWRPAEGLNLQRKWYFAWPRNSVKDLRVRSLMWLCEAAGQGLEQGNLRSAPAV